MIHFIRKYAYEGKVKKSKIYSPENLQKVKEKHELIVNKKGLGADMMGWMDYVKSSDVIMQIEKMLALYNEWQEEKVNTVLVSGIGGSSVGARAAIHMCINKYMVGGMKVIWMDSISPSGNAELLRHLKKDKIRVAGIVISKSGTTLETTIGYRFIEAVLKYKYEGKSIENKLAIVTGENDNVLHKLAVDKSYPLFTIPNNIGGRFSSLTAAGLLPMIMSGIDVFEVIQGAKDALSDCSKPDVKENSAYEYALHRYCFEREGYVNEIVDSYEKKLGAMLEQYKQIFAESEAKDGKGLLPVPVTYTRDLHSVGQYLQDGPDSFFETTIWVRRSSGNAKIPSDNEINDGLDYLDGVWLSEVNRLIYKSVAEAHAKIRKTPVLILELDKMNPYDYGYLFMWLSISVTMSAYLNDTNPFDQPGVEAYKTTLNENLKEFKKTILERRERYNNSNKNESDEEDIITKTDESEDEEDDLDQEENL